MALEQRGCADPARHAAEPLISGCPAPGWGVHHRRRPYARNLLVRPAAEHAGATRRCSARPAPNSSPGSSLAMEAVRGCCWRLGARGEPHAAERHLHRLHEPISPAPMRPGRPRSPAGSATSTSTPRSPTAGILDEGTTLATAVAYTGFQPPTIPRPVAGWLFSVNASDVSNAELRCR
jgi:hypothetical protein